MITFACIVPHTPNIVPGIADEAVLSKLEKTIAAMNQLREALEKSKPDTIVIISEHTQLSPHLFAINSASELEGSFDRFGLEKRLTFQNNREIIDRIYYSCRTNELESLVLRDHPLDYGAMVALHSLAKNIKPKVVHLSFSVDNFKAHHEYGQLIGHVCHSASERVAVVASGDLSHRIHCPRELPESKTFDDEIIKLLGENNVPHLVRFDEGKGKAAEECCLRAIIMLLGIVSVRDYAFDMLHYESPLGVGYLTARVV